MRGITRLHRVVAEFHVWLEPTLFPHPKMKVKVMQRSEEDFAAFPNLHRLDSAGNPEYLSGLGRTSDEALSDLLTEFVKDAEAHRPPAGYEPRDFEWSESSDF